VLVRCVWKKNAGDFLHTIRQCALVVLVVVVAVVVVGVVAVTSIGVGIAVLYPVFCPLGSHKQQEKETNDDDEESEKARMRICSLIN
jgi:hypothetical protein